MNSVIRKNFILAAALFIAVSVFQFCGGPARQSKALVSFYSGTVMLKSGGSPFRSVKLKDQIQNGDIIETGEKSSMIVQVGDELIVRFEENTRAVINSITSIEKREISLDQGKVLSKVSKLKRGSEYMIKTPTVVASVRGTEFLTDYNGLNTTVAVGKGRVSVVKSDSKTEKLVDSGKSVVVEVGMELRDINRVETLELKKLETTRSVDNIESVTPETLKKEFESSQKSDEEINEEIDRLKGMSLDDIRAKYHRIDVVKMYNGRVIRGVILQRGQQMKILTPTGVITVRAKDVKNTGVM